MGGDGGGPAGPSHIIPLSIYLPPRPFSSPTPLPTLLIPLSSPPSSHSYPLLPHQHRCLPLSPPLGGGSSPPPHPPHGSLLTPSYPPPRPSPPSPPRASGLAPLPHPPPPPLCSPPHAFPPRSFSSPPSPPFFLKPNIQIQCIIPYRYLISSILLPTALLPFFLPRSPPPRPPLPAISPATILTEPHKPKTGVLSSPPKAATGTAFPSPRHNSLSTGGLSPYSLPWR